MDKQQMEFPHDAELSFQSREFQRLQADGRLEAISLWQVFCEEILDNTAYGNMLKEHVRRVIQKVYQECPADPAVIFEPEFYDNADFIHWAQNIPLVYEPQNLHAVYPIIMEHVRNRRYDLIDYSQPAFNQLAYAMLRRRFIDAEQLSTLVTIQSFLFYLKGGQIEKDSSALIRRQSFTNPDSSYIPADRIKTWSKAKQQSLMKYHRDGLIYYTANFKSYQSIALLYMFLSSSHLSQTEICINFYSKYLDYNRKDISVADAEEMQHHLNKLTRSTKPGVIAHAETKLKTLLEKYEAWLLNFLDENDQKLDYTDAIFTGSHVEELHTLKLIMTILDTGEKLPYVVVSDTDEPLYAMVLPDFHDFRILQNIANENQARYETAAGRLSMSMIRAWTELPGLPVEQRTPKQQELNRLFAGTARHKIPTRVVETYSMDVMLVSSMLQLIKDTNKVHDGYNFWFHVTIHDMFHAWRAQSASPEHQDLCRRLAMLHDNKGGIARNTSYLPNGTSGLADRDFGFCNLREGTMSNQQKQQKLLKMMANYFLKISGFDFSVMTDDNYLLIYDMCTNQELYAEKYFYGVPVTRFFVQSDDDRSRVFLSRESEAIVENIHDMITRVNRYLQRYPDASVLEILFADKLQSLFPRRKDLLHDWLQRFDFKNIFYWSANTGICIMEQFRDDARTFELVPKVSNHLNAPEHLLQFMQQVQPEAWEQAEAQYNARSCCVIC